MGTRPPLITMTIAVNLCFATGVSNPFDMVTAGLEHARTKQRLRNAKYPWSNFALEIPERFDVLRFGFAIGKKYRYCLCRELATGKKTRFSRWLRLAVPPKKIVDFVDRTDVWRLWSERLRQTCRFLLKRRIVVSALRDHIVYGLLEVLRKLELDEVSLVERLELGLLNLATGIRNEVLGGRHRPAHRLFECRGFGRRIRFASDEQ